MIRGEHFLLIENWLTFAYAYLEYHCKCQQFYLHPGSDMSLFLTKLLILQCGILKKINVMKMKQKWKKTKWSWLSCASRHIGHTKF